MLDTKAPEAKHISGLWWLMLILATGVFVAVTGLVVVALLRRRRTPADAGAEPPSTRRDHRFILVGGLFVPTAILAVVAVYTVRTMNDILPTSGVVHIHVAGERWWWRVDYPDLGITTANEVHVPVGERVDISLTSDNVIHSFWVPQLNGKADLIPGQTNHLSFTATTAGTYRGQCAEFCGLQHAHMAFLVIADPPATFQQWASGQRQPAAAPADPLSAQGAQILATTSCAGCHTVTGTAANGTAGPDLTHVGGRSTLASDTLPNNPDGMSRWLAHTQLVKPGALMPQLDLSDQDVRALTAYLESLR